MPLLRKVRLERITRSVYEAIHAYRDKPRLLVGVFALTVVVQAVRVLAIWAAAKAVGVDLSPRVYYVMGPLLFLVLLVPFTINGIAVRESFFVSFLGGSAWIADRAFATGFMFFVVTITISIPGALILGWESIRRRAPRPTEAQHVTIDPELAAILAALAAGCARRRAAVPAVAPAAPARGARVPACGRSIVFGERTCDCEAAE